MANVPDLSLTRALLDEKFLRLRPRDRTLLRSLVAFDVFVGPQLLALFLGLPAPTVATSLAKLKRAGLVRATDDGSVGISYRVLRDILPASWPRRRGSFRSRPRPPKPPSTIRTTSPTAASTTTNSSAGPPAAAGAPRPPA